MTVKTSPAELDSERSVGTTRPRLKVFAIGSAIALLLLIAMQWPQASSDVTAVTAPRPNEAETLSAFQYFPAQYRSSAQSGPPEEQIQAY